MRRLTWIVMPLLFLIVLAGCTEAQRLEVDKVAVATAGTAAAGQAALHSPAGIFIPVSARTALEVVFGIASVASTGWLYFRKKTK